MTPLPQPTSSTDDKPSSRLSTFMRDGWVFPSGPERKKILASSGVQWRQFSFNFRLSLVMVLSSFRFQKTDRPIRGEARASLGYDRFNKVGVHTAAQLTGFLEENMSPQRPV